MGYMCHHAIVVTGYGEHVAKAREVAYDIACDLQEGEPHTPYLHVTEVSPEALNGYRSFLICPDGSKEGWRESAKGDTWREQFIDCCRTNAFDVSWAEVQFGDDGGQNKLLRSS